jgi:HAD superfamily phosphoserine phosphatase-like hydrolase
MHKLAIYDMDKTITRKATFGSFLAYATPRHRAWRTSLSPLLLLTSMAYGSRLIDRARLKELNTALMLGHRLDPERVARISKGFAVKTAARNILKGALERIAGDHADGYRTVMATASYGFYAREIGAAVGIDDVIATGISERGDRFSPRISGVNCYGGSKLDMVKAWLDSESLKREDCHIRFYSDHVSDAPCLEWADEAFVTNAHLPLRRMAKARGWTILNWK